MKRHLLTAMALALLPATGHAQSASASVKARVFSDVTLTPYGHTDFGTVGNSEAKTHTINPNSPGPEQSTAKFVADGEKNEEVKVTFDATVTLCHETSGCGTSLTFTSNVAHLDGDAQCCGPSNLLSGSTVRLSADGKYYFWLGGKIDVPAGQLTGRYEGTFTITVVYA
jgi:hypothetical protein